MIMVRTTCLIGVLALSACQTTVPNSGVGFGDLGDLQPIEQPIRSGASGPFVAGGQISTESALILQSETPTGQLQPVESLENMAASAIDAAENGSSETAAVEPSKPGGNAGISDEQDFDAVASRESIESDRERLAANREAYQLIQPGALPTRRGNDGALIVEFALATNHGVGVAVYSRMGLSGQARFDRNCAKYASQDMAQMAFLAAGGPERDRYGIDPDGDGYACYWDPTPFRAAVGR
jgi:hypothetical protein